MHHHFTKTGSGRTRGKLKKVARVHLGEVRARSRELAALRTGQGAAAAQVRTYTKKKPGPFCFPAGLLRDHIIQDVNRIVLPRQARDNTRTGKVPLKPEKDKLLLFCRSVSQRGRLLP
jgi:hypothetical protein